MIKMLFLKRCALRKLRHFIPRISLTLSLPRVINVKFPLQPVSMFLFLHSILSFFPSLAARLWCSFLFPWYRTYGVSWQATRHGEFTYTDSRLHAVPFFSLNNLETGASEMHDLARDWSDRGRQPCGEWGRGKKSSFLSFLPILRAAVPLARSSLSINVDEKSKGLRAVYIHPKTRLCWFSRLLSLPTLLLPLCRGPRWTPPR